MHRVESHTRVRTGWLVAAAVGAAAAAVMSGSCLGTGTAVCEISGLRCKAGQVCSLSQDACIDPGGCGDGRVTGDEVCDDGNTRGGDGCSADCRSTEVCGNHIIDREAGEQCDDGNSMDGDGCSPSCMLEQCGNKILDPGEVCDDGNTTPDDGCSADCMSNEACGNGKVDNDAPGGPLHEDCDPTSVFPLQPSDTPECNSDCTFPRCGDGHHNPMYTPPGAAQPEQCDEGGDTRGCDSDCTFVVCGDGHPNHAAGEDCDLGANNSNQPDAACRKDCHAPSCGDGITDPMRGERCDDGNNDITDACPDGPDGSCQQAFCGDGFVKGKGSGPQEACDKGDPSKGIAPRGCRSGTHCNSSCSACDPD